MKNILARGGIEFLAVLLGITLSLWIDNINKQSELDKEIHKSLSALSDELEIKIADLSKQRGRFEKSIKIIEKTLTLKSLKGFNHAQLDEIFDSVINHLMDDYKHSVYKSLEISGLIYSIQNINLRNKIIRLYSEHFSILGDALNYNLDVIKKLDDIVNRDFEFRNEFLTLPKLNWNNPTNLLQFKNNIEFRNSILTSRVIKHWVLRQIDKTKEEAEQVQQEIKRYINE
ncbi:hypothetical protein OAQ57_01255 [Candidatus Marinimicrobia bacterium]|nr:hypothetical protein [Candidatus Neomarinimicrobiota bacterium]|tara:strand:- start:219 stop:905 length:687 start_codon:yes stop_codon:yes gene_type:complete